MEHVNLHRLVAAAKLLTSALGIGCHQLHAQAQPYPTKLIQLIAQQPPGSQMEAISRVWAECASRELGQPIVILNKPGANGVLANVNFLKSQPADGYNIMTVGMSHDDHTLHLQAASVQPRGETSDGVTVLSTSPLLLVASVQSGIKQYADIATVAKKSNGGIDFGSPGKGKSGPSADRCRGSAT